MKYKQIKDGEIVYPIMRGFRLICCDCGLVHTINFSHRGAGKSLAFQAWRDDKATKRRRKK